MSVLDNQLFRLGSSDPHPAGTGGPFLVNLIGQAADDLVGNFIEHKIILLDHIAVAECGPAVPRADQPAFLEKVSTFSLCSCFVSGRVAVAASDNRCSVDLTGQPVVGISDLHIRYLLI